MALRKAKLSRSVNKRKTINLQKTCCWSEKAVISIQREFKQVTLTKLVEAVSALFFLLIGGSLQHVCRRPPGIFGIRVKCKRNLNGFWIVRYLIALFEYLPGFVICYCWDINFNDGLIPSFALSLLAELMKDKYACWCV